MDMNKISDRGMVLLGCGKMGSAMLSGWLAQGLPASSVWVVDPHPSDWLKGLDGLHLNRQLPESPAVVLIAVKPQMMAEALPALRQIAGHDGTLFISVAAGIPLSVYQEVLGPEAVIIRAMPNTPAAIGKGITALIGNQRAGDVEMALAEGLLRAVGQTVRLENEGQIDAVTGVSGSGPAYVFHLIEALAEAGQAEGLSQDLAMQLAKATVAGAGALAEQADEPPARLRENVTSPGGTTAAALGILMDEKDGLRPLMRRAVRAAVKRSQELGS